MRIILVIALITLAACSGSGRITDQSMIDEINASGTSWVAGFNSRFRNTTPEEMKMHLGALKVPREVLEKKLPVRDVLTFVDLPESYDARAAYPQCESLQETRDQSSCGSCWAFSSAEVMSDRICIKSNGKLQTRVSAEELVSCCDSCGYGCNGGYPFEAFSYWADQGLVSGGLFEDKNSCQPYAFPPCEHHTTGKYKPCGEEYETPACKNTCVKGYPKTFQADKEFGSAYSVSADEHKIMQEIVQNGPVGAAFSVYDDFPTYKSGVYRRHSSKMLGGHAVKIVGFGVENGTKYWLVVNSWNEDWGDKGTFKIVRGENHCGIEDEIVAGLPKLDKLSFLQ